MSPRSPVHYLLYVDAGGSRLRTAHALRERYPLLQLAASSREARRLVGPWCGLIVERDLPDGSGIDLADELSRRSSKLLVALIEDRGDSDASPREHAVMRILRPLGDAVLDPFFAELARLGHGSDRALVAAAAEELALSERQRQILAHVLIDALTYRQVAAELGISEWTVKSHVRTILDRAGGVTMRDLRRRWCRWRVSGQPLSPFGVATL